MFKSISYVCQNCNRHLMSDMKFCATCGQRSDTHRLTMKHIAHDFFHALTHTDKSFFVLLKMLVIKPGIVARDYVEGKRQKYLNPFTFFLLCMAIFVVVNGFFIHPPEMQPDPNILKQIPAEAVRKSYILNIERGNRANGFMNRNGNILGMVALPLYTLFTWTFFKKRGYNFAEHLTANVFFVGFANLGFTFLFTPFMGLTIGTPHFFMFLFAGLLVQIFYMSWAQFQFLGFRKKASYLKTLGVMLLADICWYVLTVSGFVFYMFRQNFFSAVRRMLGWLEYWETVCL